MNKLCCIVNPIVVCSYCGERWCRDCAEHPNWGDLEHSHDYHKVSKRTHPFSYYCPVAKEVQFNYDTKPFRLE